MAAKIVKQAKHSTAGAKAAAPDTFFKMLLGNEPLATAKGRDKFAVHLFIGARNLGDAAAYLARPSGDISDRENLANVAALLSAVQVVVTDARREVVARRKAVANA